MKRVLQFGATVACLALPLLPPAHAETAPRQTGNAAAAAAEAMQADRAFAARAAEVSPAQAFSEFMEPQEGLLFGTGGEPARGRAQIYELLGGSAPPRVELRWTPKQAWGSASGDMAVTVGDWRRVFLDGKRPPMTGNYVTVWRRTDQGWKGLIDIGETDAAEKSKPK